MLGFLSKLFGGSKSQKDVKILLPIVEKTNLFFQQYQSLSNDELRGKTVEFKERINAHLKDLDTEIENLAKEADALTIEDIAGRDAIFQDIDKLKKERNTKIEEVLKELQPCYLEHGSLRCSVDWWICFASGKNCRDGNW
jgi:preprotein translocase subunit SecA